MVMLTSATNIPPAHDFPITLLAPTSRVQPVLRAFLSIPTDLDSPTGDKLFCSLPGLLHRIGGHLIHPTPLPPTQHHDHYRPWNGAHITTTHTAVQIRVGAICAAHIATRIHDIMHTTHARADTHTFHQAPSCIATHPHTIHRCSDHAATTVCLPCKTQCHICPGELHL